MEEPGGRDRSLRAPEPRSTEDRDQNTEDGGPLLNRFHVQRGKQKAEIASQGFRLQDPLKFRNERW
jgi:hypothetical protein